MNKAELASELARRLKLSKSKAVETLNATFETIKSSLKKGQRVQLVGFGTFSVKQRKPGWVAILRQESKSRSRRAKFLRSKRDPS